MNIGVSSLRARLTAAHCDDIVSGSHVAIPCLIHVAEITRAQHQFHVLLLTRFQVHALESA